MPTIIERTTNGTTIIFNELRKISPRTEKCLANPGANPPIITPRIIAPIIPMRMEGLSPFPPSNRSYFRSDPFIKYLPNIL